MRAGGINQWRLAGDIHSFALGADLQCGIQGEHLVQVQNDILAEILFESLLLHGKLVGANRDLKKRKVAVTVGLRAAGDTGRLIGQSNVGAGNLRACGIGDPADDSPASGLGGHKG